MANYRRVTYGDRCQIQAFLQAKISISRQSKELGFHRSTLYRELKRVNGGKYRAERAQLLAWERFERCRRRNKIEGQLEKRIVSLLEQDWSPEEVSQRLRREGKGEVSHETIYRYVWQRRPELRRLLRRHGRRGAGRLRQRKTRLTANKRWIRERPRVAERRGRIGDWERDTMYCARRKLVLVCTDRKSRYTRITKLKNYTIRHASQETMRLLRAKPLHTITNDNGPEFRDGPNMKVPVYYCDPQKPNQRGTVENTIGLLRQYITRSTEHQGLSRKRLKAIEDRLNHRPRRCLDYRTPYEVFYGKSVALVT